MLPGYHYIAYDVEEDYSYCIQTGKPWNIELVSCLADSSSLTPYISATPAS
jgi:hypothetical protein